MAYSAIAVANAFIEIANEKGIDDLSQMKLQKLVFFAQSWSLRLYDEPLIEDFFAKWEYGPVVTPLYHATKMYGRSHISTLIGTLEHYDGGYRSVTPSVEGLNHNFKCLIDNIIKVYGGMTASALSKITHLPGSAWSKAGKSDSVLTNQMLKDCISIEEGRFMSNADFPFNFDLRRMEKVVDDEYVTVPKDLTSFNDFTSWLKDSVK